MKILSFPTRPIKIINTQKLLQSLCVKQVLGIAYEAKQNVLHGEHDCDLVSVTRTVCGIFMKFGAGILYKKLSMKHEICESQCTKDIYYLRA